ncbi:MAG TPA: metallophosphoesterase [Candidatus Acidoferrum sp.]|nr:metallophosphoesterase [Candidatus Acidoferrum sp.]
MFSLLFCSIAREARKMACSPDWVPLQRTRIFVLLLLAWAAPSWAEPAKAPAEPAESVVAIGDVHNDFDDFLAILRHTGLIDLQNHWTGGKTTFVQVGDLLDRGPKPREVMDLMMALEKEAAQAGGRVVSLLGNHEMMNIMGDLRYVTPLNYASYADGNSEKRQKAAYGEYVKWKDSHASLIAELTQPLEMTEAEWMARHPAGFIEQREAFGPKGKYGEWLRGHAAVAEIEGIIFLHGGIHPDLAKTKPDAMNNRIREEIKAFDALKQYLQNEKLILPFFNLQEINSVLQAEVTAELKSHVLANDERKAKVLEFSKLNDWLSVRADGPLWFRGYDKWSEEEGASQVSKLLEGYKATHLVVAHTVQNGGRIRPRFGNKVFLIDTGMLSSYYPGGRASALEICADAKFIAVYLDQQVVLLDPAGSSPKNRETGEHPGMGNGATVSEKLSVLPADRICSGMTATPQ